MSTADVLRKAKVKIEQGWCQLASARDASGNPVHPGSPSACEFCMTGAIEAAAGMMSRNEYLDLSKHVRSSLPVQALGIPSWNDSRLRTKEEVLAVFDKAIERAEKEEAACPK